MNALIVKEIRLVRPAFVAALGLAVIPIWLLPRDGWTPGALTLCPFTLAVALLALSTFGRELGLATLPLMLVQPVARRRIWWSKIGVLAGATAAMLVAWWVSWFIFIITGTTPSDAVQTSVMGLPVAMALLTGGLWSTLLLRQVAGALFFTILIPAGLAILIAGVSQDAFLPVVTVTLVTYAIGGFVLAWWLFLRAQEIMWTGGAVTMSGWGQARSAAGVPERSRRPFAALLAKELHFHRVSLAGIGALTLLHLVVVVLRWFLRGKRIDGMAEGVLNFYPFIWLFVPLLVGCLSIAEERRLGTMDVHLGLPVARRYQIVLKFLFVLVLGFILSFGLLFFCEGLAMGLGVPAAIGIFEPKSSFLFFFVALLALSLIAFYASSLTSSLVQSLAVAVGLSGLCFILSKSGPDLPSIFGSQLWQGPIFHLVAWPILVTTLVVLAYGNFGALTGHSAIWRRNLTRLALALAAITAVTSLLYQRCWEFAMQLEPAHGPAKINRSALTNLRSYYNNGSFACVLPDGRLISTQIEYRESPGPGPAVVLQRSDGGKLWMGPRSRSVAGSNWVDAITMRPQIAAIRSDGTLWISQKPALPPMMKGSPPVDGPAPSLTQFGTATNWSRIVRGLGASSLLLLKTDGTLWQWGTNTYIPDRTLDLRDYEPRLLATGSNWAAFVASARFLYLWKTNGEAWMLHSERSGQGKRQHEVGSELFLERFQDLDKSQWREVASVMGNEVGLRADGTLWTWQYWSNVHDTPTKPTPFHSSNDWAHLSGSWGFMTGLKTDGSLWLWRADMQRNSNSFFRDGGAAPTRLGRSTDWLAMISQGDGVLTLAADGGLWYWQGGYGYPPPLLTPSRKPIQMQNLLTLE